MAEAIGGKGSLVWNYFTKVSDSKAKCNVCGKELASTSGSTTSLARHLESKHRDKFAEYTDAKKTRDAEREGIRKRKQMDDGPPKKQAKLSFHTPANDQALQEQFNTALLEHIAETQSPFSQFGTPSFIKLIGIANKRIKVQHPTTLSRNTSSKAQNVLGQVCDIIAAVKSDLESVCYTTDLWTSRVGDSFISLTVSFIDKNWVLHNWTPFIRHFPERHLGSTIALELDSMIEQLGLNVDFLDQWSTNDNAANMVKSIRESEYLQEYFCDIHTLQLAINDAFKDVDGMNNVLTKSKALARFTHQSGIPVERLKVV